MSNHGHRKRVNFYERCEEIKKAGRRNVSSIYNEFTHIRFFDIYKSYESAYSKNKDTKDNSNEAYDRDRAEMVAFGCFSNYEELEKSHKS